jgi:catechol 2,3-dioxygenase-like lactoylglutathione lyase family enzyme
VPEAHAGRLFDHVHIRVRDIDASKRFYVGTLEALGLRITAERMTADGDRWFSADELFVSDDGEPTAGLHIAFQTPDRETVDRFHEAVVATTASPVSGRTTPATTAHTCSIPINRACW